MGYRMPAETQGKIIRIKTETDPKKALEDLVDLFENFVEREKQVPTKYDPRTGKPTRFKWEPDHKFNSKICLRGEDLTDFAPEEPGLARNVIDTIKSSGPILINTNFGTYVIGYEEIGGCQQEQGGGYYNYVDRSISVKKVIGL